MAHELALLLAACIALSGVGGDLSQKIHIRDYYLILNEKS